MEGEKVRRKGFQSYLEIILVLDFYFVDNRIGVL